MKVNLNKDPEIYCKICNACGEEGCCPAFVCENHKDGLYCEMYKENQNEH